MATPGNPTKHANCDPQQLERYLNGNCLPQDAETVERHLDDCETCRLAIEQQAAEADFWVATSANLDVRSDITTTAMPPLEFNDDDPGSRRFLQDWLDPSESAELGVLNQYQIHEVVGIGGMGLVLRGHDATLNREIAIKTLRQYLLGSGAARRRFSREAQIAASLNHPHVVPIFSVDSWRDVPYIVMPFVPQSLRQYTKNHALSLPEILRVGYQIATGLAAAHNNDMVHRDIKPANILLMDGLDHVLISDFGLARAMDDDCMTMTGQVAGTPQFMSPEQARGEAIDTRSDMFSFGCLLYWMCVSKSPFAAETNIGSLGRVLHEPYEPLSQLRPDLPRWMGRLLDKLLVKDRDDRSLTAQHTAFLLKQLIDHTDSPQTRIVPAELLPAKPPRSYRTATFVGIAAAGLAGLAIWQSGKFMNDSEAERAIVAASEEQAASDSEGQATKVDVEPLTSADRDLMLAEFKAGKRQDHWLTRLGQLPVRDVPVELIPAIMELSEGSDAKLSALADSVLSKNPFEELPSEDVENPFVPVD